MNEYISSTGVFTLYARLQTSRVGWGFGSPRLTDSKQRIIYISYKCERSNTLHWLNHMARTELMNYLHRLGRRQRAAQQCGLPVEAMEDHLPARQTRREFIRTAALASAGLALSHS